MAETRPITTTNASGEDVNKAQPVPRPNPSQSKADDIREQNTADEAPKKSKDKGETPEDPFPTQADLDAMRAGTFKEYKTR